MQVFERDENGNIKEIEFPPKRADMVCVVRCKDCKHYDGLCGCKLWHDVGSHSADWYCADGIKKE